MGYDLLLDRFHANVQKFPNKLAVAFVSSGNSISIERQLTYLELDEITTKLAKSLKQQYNIQDGDRYVKK